MLATDVTIRQGGRVEIHTEGWVDEAGSHRFQSVVVHGIVPKLCFDSILRQFLYNSSVLLHLPYRCSVYIEPYEVDPVGRNFAASEGVATVVEDRVGGSLEV